MASAQWRPNETEIWSGEDFGPVSRIRTFDFTFLFEQSIMSIGPSAILLLVVPLRWFCLRSHQRKTKTNGFLSGLKLMLIVICGALQIAQLVFWVKIKDGSPAGSQISVAANTLGVCDFIALAFLSYLEQKKSIRPSTIITVYLIISIAFDSVQCRSLWLSAGESHFRKLAGLLSCSIAIRLSILVLEGKGKGRILFREFLDAPPEALSGIIQRGVFWWLNDLLLKGFKSSLSIDTLWPTDNSMDSAMLLENIQRKWQDERTKPGKRQLLFALLKALKWQILYPLFARVCLIGLRFSQPLLINRIVRFISQPKSQAEQNIGYGLIGATALIYLGLAIMKGIFTYETARFLTMTRGSLVSMILSTTLSLPENAEGSATLTLMSVDIERICLGLEGLHDMWASPIEVGIAIWLLEREMGVACIVPSVIAIAATGAIVKLTSYIGPAQVAWNKAVQERVSVTSEILESMKEVKLLGITDLVSEKILQLRIKELNGARKSRTLGSIRVTLVEVSSYLTPAITFGAFIAISKYWTGESLSVQKTFTSLALIVLLAQPLETLFASIPRLAITTACLGRIQAFLQSAPAIYSTRDLAREQLSVGSNIGLNSGIELQSIRSQFDNAADPPDNVITVQNASFGTKDSCEPILRSLSLSIPRASISVIIGKVGSGKSTLLKALIGEIPNSTGTISRSFGDIAYCDQRPWLVNGSIQNNILGNSKLEAKWYQTVIESCVLNVDFESLPNGDRSIVGSRGISLSGGQKQRVALARALYSRLPFLVCDDILSGLDPQTQDLIWDNIFGTHGLLRLHRITTVLATHSVHRLRETDHLVVLGDGGTIVEQGTFESLTTGNGYAKEVLTRAPENSSKISQFRDAKSPAREKEPEAQMVEQSENSNDLLRRTGDMQVYNYYLKSIGWYHGVVLFLLTFAGEFCLFFPQIWVKWWAEADSRNPGAQTGLYYTVYLLLGVIGLLLVGSAVRYNFVITGPDSGAYLHLKLLNAIMRAPLSFFVRTDTGVTVNRFSQDLSLVDMVLPGNSWLTFVGIIKSIGISTLILMGIKYMAAVIPLTVLVLYLLQLFYLRTSRQLRHLDLEAKSPLYTHLLEGIQGLTTIRAYNWTSSFQKTGLGLLDVSQRPFYLLYCIQRWLNFVLDILVALLAVFFVGITVSLKGQTTAGAVGLALLNILSLNSTLAFTIETWTELETSLGAIARLRAIESTTESEEIEQSEVIMPTAEWPQEGKIVFESMTVAYAKDSNPVLRDVNLTIKHGEKVAICGRTGSGKSTLILALTHLLDPIHGTRVISGIDTKCIPRSFLRSKLNTIPQEPFFLSSQFTLGENLSLFCNPPPDESSLTSALDIVQLSHLKPLLSSGMASVSLSQGEKQLFCLARAIVKKDSSPFLILDEANAALDIEKDELMHEILRKEFASKTIVSVVHKLQDIVGFYDKVLVLDQDGVAEFDDPAVLLQNEGSVFRGMVREKI